MIAVFGEGAIRAKRAVYAEHDVTLSNEETMDEIVADFSGKLLTDEGTIRSMASTDRSFARKIMDIIRDVAQRIKEALGWADPTMDRAAQLWENALRAAEKQAGKSQKNTAQEGGGKYSIQENQNQITAQFKKTVDAVLSSPKSSNNAVVIGYTPSVYQKMGMPSLPFVIGEGHIYSATKTKAEAIAEGKYNPRTNYHGLGADTIKDIYQAAENPVMIISSKDVNPKASPVRSTHSVVAIVDVGKGDSHLLLPVEITASRTVDGQRMDVNVLSSVYEKNTDGLITEAIAQEYSGETGVYYVTKEAAGLIGTRVQFPEWLSAAAASDGIVHKFGEKVNMNIQNSTQSQQFKRWFGDWQNKPDNASKVVNEDGSPRVVYHGTNENFNVFQSKDGTYWFSESEDYAESMMEERGGDRIVEAYLNIRNPYEATLKPGQFSDPNYEAPIIRQARAAGHDGVIIRVDTTDPLVADTFYVAFKPEQIKSATENIGTFSSDNPDIRFSISEKKDAVQEPHRGVAVSDSLADATSTASKDSIPQEASDVNSKFSFNAERQNERPSTRRTLHADVNQAGNTDEANAQPFKNSIPPKAYEVNSKFSISDGERLRSVAEDLRNQMKRTDKPKTDAKAVRAVAADLLEGFESQMDKGDLAGRLKSLYDRISGDRDISYSDMMDEAVDVAREVVEGSLRQSNELYEQYGGLWQELKGKKISVAREHRGDLDAMGGYDAFRKDHAGQFKLTDNGVPVDSVYEDLSARYPELFPEDLISPADRLLRIADDRPCR